MAYSALPTAVTGDLWTAANHNTYIKDNFAASLPDLFTTAGQIAYASAANTGSLDIGTAGQVLRVNDGATAPEWAADFSGARITTSDQDCSIGAVTTVNFDTEAYDTHNYWTTDNPDAVTMPWSGIYQFTGHASFAELSTDTTGDPYFLVFLGSSTNAVSLYYGAAGDATTVSWAHTQYCSSGTDMKLQLYFTKYSEQTTDFSAEVDYQVTWLGTT